MNAHDVLKKHFGYDSFREGQEELIQHILSHQDTLGIMPTGAGKSICYQVPAVMMEGITLVVSPLISLMKDQVGALNAAGIRSAFLNSSLTYAQYHKALQNAATYMYNIIYVAPERLLNEDFLTFAKNMKISLVCIDEAHCVSQWGQDFRPSYLKIIEFIEELEVRPVIGAFTATATEEVKEDIKRMLQLKNPYERITGFDRKNLYFAVEKPKDKFAFVASYLKENKQKSGIIYCLSRKLVEEVCQKLCAQGYRATRYHAGLSDQERHQNQDAFIYDEASIMVATNAFGMGIDKSNVNFVIHYNMPKNMESYYQEAGRAGRDGKPADCILLYGGQDVRLNQFLIEQGEPLEGQDEQTVEKVRQKDRERLRSMTFYCSIQTCLRQYMLRYFGEQGQETCDNCSSCLSNYEESDISEAAQLIMQCIKESQQRYGFTVIIDTLRGSKNAKVLQYGMDSNSCYGMLANKSQTQIRSIIQHLLLQGFLQQSEDKYAVLRLGQRLLSEDESLIMRLVKDEEKAVKSTVRMPMDQNLFDVLREVRKELARKAKVPPYIIFSDKTLQDMSEKKPSSKEEMLMVSGVGEVKYERYGRVFLESIQEYQKEKE